MLRTLEQLQGAPLQTAMTGSVMMNKPLSFGKPFITKGLPAMGMRLQPLNPLDSDTQAKVNALKNIFQK